MSKAVITMTDEKDGINVGIEFDPPFSADTRITGAQWLAAEMLRIAASILENADGQKGHP